MEPWDIEIGSHKVLNTRLCKTEPDYLKHNYFQNDDNLGCLAIIIIILAVVLLITI